MSNTPANNRPDPSADHQLHIEVHSHLDEDPEPRDAGGRPRLPAFPSGLADLLRRSAETAATAQGMRQGSIEIAVVDDPRIHQLNREFLDHDWETDVISFPYECQGDALHGELIVSWETAVREAAATGWPAATELALYVIHGTLHLCGMDDREPQGRRAMRIAEQAALAKLGLADADRYDVDGMRSAGAPERPA